MDTPTVVIAKLALKRSRAMLLWIKFLLLADLKLSFLQLHRQMHIFNLNYKLHCHLFMVKCWQTKLNTNIKLIHHPDEILGPSCVFLPQTQPVPEALLFWWEVLQSPTPLLFC